MADLPFGMKGEVEITLTIKGEASQVIAEMHRMRESGLDKKALIRVMVKAVGGASRRSVEPYELQGIIEGDASHARQSFDALARQSRISVELEHRHEAIIAECEMRTRSEAT